jgi:L-asparaginase/Glu-tRNA(Gln) amidotransferase subunit D
MDSTEYAGGIWLEGSPTIEETTYWLNLLIDTTKPLTANASQQGHGDLGNRGDSNILDSVNYITSGIWEDEDGRDKVGAVVIQEEQVFASRNIQKKDDRAGGYEASGGHGGIVGSTLPTELTFVPNRKHTWSSEVNVSRLPKQVTGVRQTSGGNLTTVDVGIKDSSGNLLPSVPEVSITKVGEYASDTMPNDGEPAEMIMEQINTKLNSEPLSGFVLEGTAPYGSVNESIMEGLTQAALHGIPVARVGRASSGGFTQVNSSDLYIEGENLSSTKARLLLMASIMKFGALPVPNDPDDPSESEMDDIRSKIEDYQQIFDTH